MSTTLADRVLDALDDAPLGLLEGEAGRVTRHMSTVQGLAAEVAAEPRSVRRAVHALHAAGLVEIWDALDATTRRRRLFVTAEGA